MHGEGRQPARGAFWGFRPAGAGVSPGQGTAGFGPGDRTCAGKCATGGQLGFVGGVLSPWAAPSCASQDDCPGASLEGLWWQRSPLLRPFSPPRTTA